MATTPDTPIIQPAGPVLFAYDGSELAQDAIAQAAGQLAPGRDALIVCVWQPADCGFVPVSDEHFNTEDAVLMAESMRGLLSEPPEIRPFAPVSAYDLM